MFFFYIGEKVFGALTVPFTLSKKEGKEGLFRLVKNIIIKFDIGTLVDGF